jgi:hypothetical protein
VEECNLGLTLPDQPGTLMGEPAQVSLHPQPGVRLLKECNLGLTLPDQPGTLMGEPAQVSLHPQPCVRLSGGV